MRMPIVVVMTLLVAGSLVLPAGAQINDMDILGGLVGSEFDDALEAIDRWNQMLLADTERLEPEQADGMRARMKLPTDIPDSNTLALGTDNYGQGLVTLLFEDDFIVEQVNLIFCEGRIAALQVLFDDSLTFGDTVQPLGSIYGMGPAVPFGSHSPALRYPLPGVAYDDEGAWNLDVGASPVTVWNAGTREALYQRVTPHKVITGQFWLADKEQAGACNS